MTSTGRARLTADQLLRFASLASMSFSVVFAGLVVGTVAVTSGSSDATVALAGTAGYLPLHLHHVWCAVRGEVVRWRWLTFAVAVAIVTAVAALIGPVWLMAYFAIAGSALVAFPFRLGLALAAASVAAVGVLAAAQGQPAGTVAWTTVGVVFRAATPFVLVWLAGAVRHLTAAQRAVASEALAAERAAVEAELGTLMEARLEAIAAEAEEAATRLSDAATCREALGKVTTSARDALATARRTLSSYRATSARAEIDAAARLLRSAGIEVRVDLAEAAASGALSAKAKATLGCTTAELLVARSASSVLIALSGDGVLDVRDHVDDASERVAP